MKAVLKMAFFDLTDMISVEKINRNMLAAKISSSDQVEFERSHALIKNLPVRKWVAKNKSWHIPIRDFAAIHNNCKKSGIEFRYPQSLRTTYEKWFKVAELVEKLKEQSVNPARLQDADIKIDEKMTKWVERFDILKIPLWRYQKYGAGAMYIAGQHLYAGALLGDPVGIGKTAQAIACTEYRMQKDIVNFAIVVCPATLKKNWEREIIKFTNRKYVLVGGTKMQRRRQFRYAFRSDYLIINYDIIYRDWEFFEEFIFSRKGLRIQFIADELQYTKNRSAQRSRATRKISAHCAENIGISATPFELEPQDIQAVYTSVDLTAYGENLQRFTDLYCQLDIWEKTTNVLNRQLLISRMRPTFIRRLKSDIQEDCPEIIDSNFWPELHPIQRKFYDDIKQKIVDEIADQEKRERIQMAEILPMIMYLRQAALSAKLVGHEKNLSTKCDQLLEFIESLQKDDKVMLFCYFNGMIEILHELLNKYKIKNVAMCGNRKSNLYVAIDDRVPIIDDWNEDPDTKFLLTTDILREGVNADKTNYVINFDILYNPSKIVQRWGRADRATNKRSHINVVNIIADNTVEVRMFEAYQHRREEGAAIMDNGRSESRMTFQEIKSLLDLNGSIKR